MLVPAIILSLSVVLIPAILTIIVSFTDWNGISIKFNWIGWKNYIFLFNDWVFKKALINNITWVILFVTIPVAIAMLAALILLNRKSQRNIFQLIFLFPYVLASITNSMLWLNMVYSPIAGVIGWLKRLGLPITSPLSSLHTALFGVAAVDIWRFWGFLMVIYLASLRQTPSEQVEAAQVEGANSFQLFRYIYLPHIMPTVRLMFAMIIIGSFMTFDYIYLISGGGPSHATEMLSTIAYTTAFYTLQIGKASAIGVIISLLGFAASVLYVYSSRKEEIS